MILLKKRLHTKSTKQPKQLHKKKKKNYVHLTQLNSTNQMSKFRFRKLTNYINHTNCSIHKSKNTAFACRIMHVQNV